VASGILPAVEGGICRCEAASLLSSSDFPRSGKSTLQF